MYFNPRKSAFLKLILLLLATLLASLLGVFIFSPIVYYLFIINDRGAFSAAAGIAVAIWSVLISFSFFPYLAVAIFGRKNKYFIAFCMIVIECIVLAFSQIFSDIIYNGNTRLIAYSLIISVVLGWFVGEGINFLVAKKSRR